MAKRKVIPFTKKLDAFQDRLRKLCHKRGCMYIQECPRNCSCDNEDKLTTATALAWHMIEKLEGVECEVEYVERDLKDESDDNIETMFEDAQSETYSTYQIVDMIYSALAEHNRGTPIFTAFGNLSSMLYSGYTKIRVDFANWRKEKVIEKANAMANLKRDLTGKLEAAAEGIDEAFSILAKNEEG